MRTAWTNAATTDGMRRRAAAGARAAARRASIAALAAVLVAVGAAGPMGARPAAAQAASPRDGTATLSGMVAATAPFTTAQVYIRNVDRRILYMVYTQAGRFRAVALFPGAYEVSVRAPGLESDVRRLVLNAGDSASLDLSLRAAGGDRTQAAPGGGGEMPAARAATEHLPYDELYPPGPGRDIAERTCMPCHGGNFLSSRPTRRAAWEAAIDKMFGRALPNRPSLSYGDGIISYRDTQRRFSVADRETLLAYLVEHFGPDAPPRRIRIEQQMPVDEAALGKAMYIEYYLPEDAPGEGVNAPEFAGLSGNFVGRRVGQDVRFDQHGNVWLTDRGYPHRVVKLDPRTGAFTDYVLPDPKNGIHEVNVDREGIIWVPEHRGVQSSEVKRLLGLDPETGQWKHRIAMDPDNVVRNAHKWMQSLAIDSKGNIYVGWIMGGALSKWERATGKVSVFPIPMPGAVPYGVVPDRNDNIWVGLWNAGKVAKFDTTTNQWTEFTPPTYPGHVRRPNVDSQNNVWFGIYQAGPRPGKLVKLDQSTGRMTEHTIPQQDAAPYDVAMDADDNIWAADVGQGNDGDHGASIWRFDPRDETFTFYPKPQPGADSPKIQVTQEGAVWYSPRGSRDAPAIGVLYPDMDRITTLGAYYQYGPPGNAFPSGQQ